MSGYCICTCQARFSFSEPSTKKKIILSMVGVFNITFSRQIIRNLNVSIDSSSTKKRDLTHERVLAYIKIPVYRK